jgi:hypothetical protein
MDAFWGLAIASFLIPGASLLVASRARFRRTVALWLLWPALLFFVRILWETLTRPATHSPLSDALLGFSLLSAIVIVPWALVSAVVLGVTLILRRFIHRPRGGAA